MGLSSARRFGGEICGRGQLSRTVRTGKPTLPAASGEAAEPYWAGIAAANLVDWERQLPDVNELWGKVGIAPENGKPWRILDIGSGAGITTFALAKKYPGVRVTADGRRAGGPLFRTAEWVHETPDGFAATAAALS